MPPIKYAIATIVALLIANSAFAQSASDPSIDVAWQDLQSINSAVRHTADSFQILVRAYQTLKNENDALKEENKKLRAQDKK